MPRAMERILTPLPIGNVAVEGGFWGPRVEVNREVTVPDIYGHLKKTGRIDAWKLDWREGRSNKPHLFWDSDVAKWIEAAAHCLGTRPDRKLQAQVDDLVGTIEQAQRHDGYLNIYFTAVEPAKRWTNLRDWHELYCAGHLMEAAVACYEATGETRLLDTMVRYADYIGCVFGPERGQKRGYPGHEEIELALIRLYRATGEVRYRDLAAFFVNERGRRPHYFDLEAEQRGDDPESHRPRSYDYNQSHLPARSQTTAEGHSVRACYLYAGMADVAAESGDRGLFQACKSIWDNVVQRRMYVTGGIGSTRHGERFTFDYDLPNEEAYAETCAAIALVFFAHRMLQVDPDGRYADVMERALYNGVLSGVSLDGRRFFYDNVLAAHPEYHVYSGQKPPRREEWYGCACCPPNLARILASVGTYAYSTRRSEVYVHLYIAGTAQVSLGSRKVELIQETDYPWKERIRLTVRAREATPFALALRIPGWCRAPELKVNGRREKAEPRKGYVKIRREWANGDRVELTLPMPAERIEAHPSVRQNCGRVALQRGPVVYCLEEADNGGDLNDLSLPRDAKLRVMMDRGLFGGVPVITARGRRRDAGTWKGKLYQATRSKTVSCAITAIPYFTWANRSEGEMLVWIREG